MPYIINRHSVKHVVQRHRVPPALKAQLNLHKLNILIRPVVNNINTHTYKVAKFLANKLKECLAFNNT
jgi:hypothetical protein